MKQTNNESQILIYETEDGQFKVEVKLHDETDLALAKTNGGTFWKEYSHHF